MSIGDAFVSVDRSNPVTLGHEGAGLIESFHPSAEGKGFQKGDAVGFLYIIRCCFDCEGCMIHNNHCLKKQSLTQGFTFDGFFAEYALVDYHSAIILPPSLDVKLAAPIFCAGVTGKFQNREQKSRMLNSHSISLCFLLRVKSGRLACCDRLRWSRPTCHTIRQGYGLQSNWGRYQ